MRRGNRLVHQINTRREKELIFSEQLRRREWDQKDLEDARMMPLGLTPTAT